MKKIGDFDSLRAAFDRNAARMKHLMATMEPEYSKAVQEGDEPQIREIERRHSAMLSEHQHLMQEQGKIAAALDKLRPGWENSN